MTDPEGPRDELEAAKAMLKIIVAGVEHAADAFEITDPHGHIEYANSAHAVLTGFPLFEVLGEKLTRFVEDNDGCVAAIEAALASAADWRGEVLCRRKDGSLRHQELVITPVVDGRGGLQRFVAVRRDVTDRIIAERKASVLRDQLAHAERLSAMGLLAASVAHEVNNPMTFAVANLGLARSEVDDLLDAVKNDQVRARIQALRDMIVDSLDGVERVVQLVRQLRTFVRADSGGRRDRISPDDAVRDAARIARTQAEGRAAIQLELGNVPPVLADRTRLGQVFLNLMVNAAQAMPAGNARHYCIVARTTTQEQDALIVIEDNGPGISEENVKKIFDPFFTTKSPDEGTGLGLAISREIVESLGGDIHVESREGAGATFKVRIPLARE